MASSVLPETCSSLAVFERYSIPGIKEHADERDAAREPGGGIVKSVRFQEAQPA